jgi:hypothetical protein
MYVLVRVTRLSKPHAYEMYALVRAARLSKTYILGRRTALTGIQFSQDIYLTDVQLS